MNNYPFHISVVIPAYNEEHRLPRTLAVISAYLCKTYGSDHEILVVDDGSRDKTSAIAVAAVGQENVITFLQNRGKHSLKMSASSITSSSDMRRALLRRAALFAALQQDGTVQNFEMALRTRSGAVIDLLWSGSTIMVAGEKIRPASMPP